MPAEGIYPYIALAGATCWFAYFLVILPLLGVLERPVAPPASVESDFAAHYDPQTGGTKQFAGQPAE